MALATRSTFQMSALALALASIGAPAANVNWAIDANGLWTVPANWMPGLPGPNDDAFITVVTGLKTITHGSGVDTVRSLTTNGSAVVLVNGASTLNIGGGASTNGNTMRSDGAGSTLAFNGGSLLNSGTLNAVDGGAIQLANVTVSGGTLSSASGGQVNVGSGAVLDGATNGPMTLAGVVAQTTNATSYFRGVFANSGDLRVGANADLRIASGNDATLNGTGTLSLGASSRVFADNAASVLTNGASHTIQGQGAIGIGQLQIVNQGLITANVAGAVLRIDPTDSPGLINTGTLRAENQGTLLLNAGNYRNAGGTVAALAGSTVAFVNGAALLGGTVATAGTGSVTFGGNAVLDGATLGAVTNDGAITVVSGQTAFTRGTVDNRGTIDIGANADLRLQGSNDLTLAGNGVLTMAAGNSRLFGEAAADVLTNTIGHTIRGQGQIGLGQTAVVNRGLITSNVGGGTLTIDPTDAAGLVNTGTLRAENGGQLNLLTGNYFNAGGTIDARAGSGVLVTNGAVVQGGTLTSAGSGSIRFEGNAVLDGLSSGAILTRHRACVSATTRPSSPKGRSMTRPASPSARTPICGSRGRTT